MIALKGSIHYIILVLLIYIYFHDPFYIPNIGGLLGQASSQLSMIILYILGVFFAIFYNKKFNSYRSVFKIEWSFYLTTLAISALITIAGGNFLMFTNHIKLLITNFIIPIFLIYYAFSIGINNEAKFIRLLLVVCCLGALGSLICMTFPTVNDFYKLSILNLNYDSFLMDGFRGFGFSTSLTSNFGYIQGALLALGIYYGQKNRWFYFFAIFVFLSSLFNARTGVIIAGIGILLQLLFNKKWGNAIFLGLIFFLFIYFLEDFVISFMEYLGYEDKAFKWIEDFFGFFDRKNSESFSNSATGLALKDMILFPEDLSGWVLGNGHDIFKRGHHSEGHSDIGFIRQLNYGGLAYLFLSLCYIIYLYKRLLRHKQQYFATFFIISFIILNTKSCLMWYQGGTMGMFLLIYYYIIFYNKEEENCNIPCS